MSWPISQVATGDLVTAAQLNMLPIALAEASGAGSSYTFSSIPQAWTHLLVVMSLQDDSGGTADFIKVQFNNDTAGNYYMQYVRGIAATASAAESLAQTSGNVSNAPGGSGGGFSTGALWIPNYAAAIKHSWTAESCAPAGTTTTKIELHVFGGFHNSAAAISTIKLFPAAGAFVAGSLATLYGMGAL